MFSTYNMTEFGRALLQARKNARLTQIEVHQQSGVHVDTLRKLENGTNIPKYETLEILSALYKVDLLEILRSKRIDYRVYDYYERMDEILVNHSLKDLEALCREYENSLSSKNLEEHLLNRNEMAQLSVFIQCCQLLYPTQAERVNDAKGLILALLNAQTKNFNLKRLKSYPFNDIEIRLLFMLGTIEMELDVYDKAIALLNFVVEYVRQNITFNKHTSRVLLKAYNNLAYCHHLIDDHQAALRYADEGIQFAIEQDTIYMLPHLYGRKAVAEYFLKDENHLDSFKKCIHLCEITKQTDLAKTYKNIVKAKYGINLDLLM